MYCIVLQNRQQLLAAAGEMGTVGGQLLLLAGDAEVDPRTQEALVTMAKAVAAATGALVTNARCTNTGIYQLRISHFHMLFCPALPPSLSSSSLPPPPSSSPSSPFPPPSPGMWQPGVKTRLCKTK